MRVLCDLEGSLENVSIQVLESLRFWGITHYLVLA